MRVIHIGFPKAATTYLQRVVFAAVCDEVTDFSKQDAAAHCFALSEQDDSILDFERSRREFHGAFSGQDNVLISCEPLTGIPYGCGFVNRSLIARRLKRVGFEQVIITIRSQFDALESAHKTRIDRGTRTLAASPRRFFIGSCHACPGSPPKARS